jgi:hypothetical protein
MATSRREGTAQSTRTHSPHEVSVPLRKNDRQHGMGTHYSIVCRQKDKVHVSLAIVCLMAEYDGRYHHGWSGPD